MDKKLLEEIKLRRSSIAWVFPTVESPKNAREEYERTLPIVYTLSVPSEDKDFIVNAPTDIDILLGYINDLEEEISLNKRKQDRYVEESFKILEEAEHKSAVARTGLAMLLDAIGNPIRHQYDTRCRFCNNLVIKYDADSFDRIDLPHSDGCVWAITTDILSKL